MAKDPLQPDEPVLVFTVRSLLRDMRDDMAAQFEKFGRMLEDRPTLGMFRASQSEVDALRRRVEDLEKVNVDRRISDRALAWGGLVVAALTAVATLLWLWIGG